MGEPAKGHAEPDTPIAFKVSHRECHCCGMQVIPWTPLWCPECRLPHCEICMSDGEDIDCRLCTGRPTPYRGSEEVSGVPEHRRRRHITRKERALASIPYPISI